MSINIDGNSCLEIVKYVHNDLVKPLVENNKMYLWRTEDTMEMLKKDRDKLKFMMEGVAFTMEEALDKGWGQLNPETMAWLSYGLDAIENANKVRSTFEDTSPAGIFLCPCEMVSFRMPNARAITRWNNINEHRKEGKLYQKDIKYTDIAVKRKSSYPQVMYAQAIRSFCAAQRARNFQERIKALLHLPDSLSYALQGRVDEEEMEKLKAVQLAQVKAARRTKKPRRPRRSGMLQPKEGSRVHAISQASWCSTNCSSGYQQQPIEHPMLGTKRSEVYEFRMTCSLEPTIEWEYCCSESLQVEDETQVSVVKEIQPKWSEDLERCESLRAEKEETDAQKIQLNHFVKYSAFPRSQCYDSVPVLIRAKAPCYTRQPRAPIDLVMVLAICGSVNGEENKLEQLKQGCKFVVHNLEETDRLSIIVASSGDDGGKPCFPLTYMTDDAKRLTNQLIASLQPRGDADMVTEAMKLADETLRGQSGIPDDDDRVGSIMLLSDGELKTAGDCEDSAGAGNCITNTLGLGRSHDPCSLYASVTRGHGHGTYSFVADSYENVREAMAMYIGGLTSIIARDAEICIRPAHPAVRISDITSGGYDCLSVEEDDGKSRRIGLNDLYASEEKSFIVYVDIPAEEAGGSIFSGTPKTELLSVTASYCCPVTRVRVDTDPVEISVERPRWGRAQDGNIFVEVASEILRTKVFNGVNEIWSQGIDPTTTVAKVVTGKLASLRKDIEGTNESKAAMDVWLDLSEDLDHMQEGGGSPGDHELYVETAGLPYMLSWLSSHRSQRAATPGSASKNRSLIFRTTRMQNMIDSVDTAPSAYIE